MKKFEVDPDRKSALIVTGSAVQLTRKQGNAVEVIFKWYTSQSGISVTLLETKKKVGHFGRALKSRKEM